MSGTAFKCGKCDGSGVLLINVSSDGEGGSFIEKPCPTCNGRGILTKAELMTQKADYTLEDNNFLPMPLTGAFRVYVDGVVYQRKMTARQLRRLAQYALNVAIETEQYEGKENGN
jgi:hypothetical protein